MSTPLTRRRVLGGAVTLLAAPPLLSSLGCAGPAPEAPTVLDGFEVPPGTKLDAPRYARLVAAMEAMVPLSKDAHATSRRGCGSSAPPCTAERSIAIG